MCMSEHEYLQRFGSQARELIVRISWCWTKKSGRFQKVGELYCARARFDQAIDVADNAIIGKGLDNWIEWLTPKKLVGHPYGHDFKKGHLYRVLVREATDDVDRRRTYLLERVFEKDVVEPRLDPLVQFADGFLDPVLERYLLVEDGASGWANVFGYRRAGVRTLGYACAADDEPVAEIGRLAWMEKESGARLKTNFDKLGVYRAHVREGRQDRRQLMLVELVGKVADARFAHIAEEYLEPVVLRNRFGTFTLDRTYDWYAGEIDYLGEPCEAYLQVEDGTTDAAFQLSRLCELCGDLAAVDRRVRAYAADEMLEDACEWCEDDLDRATFMKAISPVSVSVSEDGSVEFAFDDADIFAGHTILVDMEPDGKLVEAYIAG